MGLILGRFERGSELRAWRCYLLERTSPAGSCRQCMGPDDALRAHEILGAKTSLAIHHGTLQLADEGLDTPGNRLSTRAAQDSFLILNNGQLAELT